MSVINVQFYGSSEPAADFNAAFSFSASGVSVRRITDGASDFSASFAFAASGVSITKTVYGNADFAAAFDFAATPTRQKFGAIKFKAKFDFTANATTRLILTDPPPILDTLSGGFVRGLEGKLYANDVEIPYRRATYNAPKDSLGESYSFDLAKADLAFLPNNAVFRFEIDDEIVFDSAKLETRNLSRSWQNNAPNDSLSFSTLIDIEDKFILAPRKNIICFDKNKTSVDINNIEKLRDTDGVLIPTIARQFNGLNLYQVLKIAFVEICGFTDVVTNIPNYPLTRCDFNISTPAKQSIAQFIGSFEPICIPLADGSLRILNRKQTVPNDFEPTEITADDYAGIGLGRQSKPKQDGLRLSYQSSGEYATFLIRIAPDVITITGKVFDNNYTKQTVTETYVDFYDLFYPDNVTKTELIKRETVIENGAGFTISEQTETYTVDLQGKILKVEKSESARIPLPENGFTGSLKEIRTEVQTYEYQNDITNTRNVIPKTIKTTISAIVATDSDNQYFGQDFKQEYSEAHRPGNLTDAMSYSSFVEPVKTITKTFDQIGNGQIRVTETLIDILRDNFPVVTISETTSGDPSFNNSFAKSREIVVWRDGVNKTNPGRPINSFVGGELPLFFLIPLVDTELNDGFNLQSGSVSVEGYNESLRRGQLLEILDRDGTSLGRFIVSGFSVEFQQNRVNTNIEVEEVL